MASVRCPSCYFQVLYRVEYVTRIYMYISMQQCIDIDSWARKSFSSFFPSASVVNAKHTPPSGGVKLFPPVFWFNAVYSLIVDPFRFIFHPWWNLKWCSSRALVIFYNFTVLKSRRLGGLIRAGKEASTGEKRGPMGWGDAARSSYFLPPVYAPSHSCVHTLYMCVLFIVPPIQTSVYIDSLSLLFGKIICVSSEPPAFAEVPKVARLAVLFFFQKR